MLIEVCLILAGYLLGAIPCGVMVGKSCGVDILKEGSGNPGATNVWRVLGWKAGSAVFFLDFIKGCVPGIAGTYLLSPQWGFFAGLAAVVGHMLSPFLKFKGGKGIATAFGAAAGSIPAVAFSAFALFLLTLAITRYVSLSSIVAMFAAVGFGIYYHVATPVLACLIALGAFIIFKHRQNMVRLLNGTESKFQVRTPGDANAGRKIPAVEVDPDRAVALAEDSDSITNAGPRHDSERA